MSAPAMITLPIQDPVLVFATVMLLMLLAPLAFNRFRMPGIIGLIVAGVLVGPNALNILDRSESVQLLGTVGLLYIMFLAGLEIDLGRFNRQRHRSLVFGLMTFLIPQVVGTAVFLALGFSWPAAILIASMFASHTLVAYPVARRLGIAKNAAVTTAVGGTIFTDTAALLVLAVVAGSWQGELSAQFWTTLTLFFTAYLGVIVFLLPPLGSWFFKRVQDQGMEFAFVLGVVFLSAWAAGAIGTEPIIGAFFAGLALNRLVPDTSPLMSRIQFFGDSFIIPFFLISIGMLVDLSVLAGSVTAWVVMGAMLATNVGTKWIASMSTARIFNYSKEQGWVIFGLSTCEAAATLAATLVGYELGIFGDEVLNGVILMIFATCLLGPWVVGRFGAIVARQEREKPLSREDAPQRILVPLANPQTSGGLMDLAFMLRQDNGVPIHPMTVVPEGSVERVAESEEMLGAALAHGAAADVPVHPITRVDTDIVGGITRAIQEKRITDVIIGWNGERPAGPRMFGTVLDELLSQTDQRVLVCKLARPVNTISRIVFAVPPSAEREPGFEKVAERVKSLAKEMGADLFIVAVAPRLHMIRKIVESAKPRVETIYHPLTDWSDLKRVLGITFTQEDLFLLAAQRPRRGGWDPAIGELPLTVSQDFPDGNFCTIYGEIAGEDEAVTALTKSLADDPEES